MSKIILVLGGARSGKSRFAEQIGEGSDDTLVYIATAQAFDAEMTARIARHRDDRPPRWQTVECPLEIVGAIEAYDAPGQTIVIDCLTLWLSNLMLSDHDCGVTSTALAAALGTAKSTVILVSNEVGQGIVPDNALARQFRDEAGWLNQKIAQCADEVWFITAGLAHRLK